MSLKAELRQLRRMFNNAKGDAIIENFHSLP